MIHSGSDSIVNTLLNRQDINLNAMNQAGQTALDIEVDAGNQNITN